MDLRTAGLVIGWYGVIASILVLNASVVILSQRDYAVEDIVKNIVEDYRISSMKDVENIKKGTPVI